MSHPSHRLWEDMYSYDGHHELSIWNYTNSHPHKKNDRYIVSQLPGHTDSGRVSGSAGDRAGDDGEPQALVLARHSGLHHSCCVTC